MKATPGQFHWHHVYYLTRPDFIKHDHIHRRKVEALRSAGLHASLVSFVPQDMYSGRRAEYESLAADGMRRVVVVPTAEQVNQAMHRFFIRRLLFYRRVLVQVLLCDPQPLLSLKHHRFLGQRLRCIIEHEGDIASECLYRWTFDQVRRPPDQPPPQFKEMYDWIVTKEGNELRQADGAVLVTPAHRALWEERLKGPLEALTLPTLFDPARFRFSAADRQRLRAELGLQDKLVLTYSGSVSMPWQRFESVCQLIARLLKQKLPVRLLALIHPDGHPQAQKVIQESGIKNAALLLGVAPAEMAAYLSAADVALFLRHTHVMNRVVTSAKLGEYIAAGLPVLTTWACPYYRPLVDQHTAGLEVPDSLELPVNFQTSLAPLAAKGQDPVWRAAFSAQVLEAFGEENNLMNSYAQYIAAKLR